MANRKRTKTKLTNPHTGQPLNTTPPCAVDGCDGRAQDGATLCTHCESEAQAIVGAAMAGSELTGSDPSQLLGGTVLAQPEVRTIHVIGLHHTIPDERFSHCAFTGKVLRFSEVLHRAGLRVVEYSNGKSASKADQHAQIFSEAQLLDHYGERL